MIELTRFAGLTAAVVLGWSGPGSADDLAKASQNPVGDLISVPFEFSYYGGLPGESSAALLLAKPVVPVTRLGKGKRARQHDCPNFQLLAANPSGPARHRQHPLRRTDT